MATKRVLIIGLAACFLSIAFIGALAVTHPLDANGNPVARVSRP